MGDNYTGEPEDGSTHSGSGAMSRRELRASNVTGALPKLGVLGMERAHPGTHDFEQMLQSLHDLFEHDRQIASQADATRCGICYLHYHVSELHYEEDGFYVCSSCVHSIGQQHLPMVRKQQKL
ncbi:MAG: hypothetical protein NVS2B12_32620 [Ktedonobacteraceae bacterium]